MTIFREAWEAGQKEKGLLSLHLKRRRKKAAKKKTSRKKSK